ncbi:MAG: MFS transporter [Candidatus Cloacimonadaceae bacterium]|nr:MFS transporter [Candidatus Cloacimonadota bacterium]MDY0127430.1 MFS transporter [Candidatus Cloacimonadaceae bacterium]MCB5254576.1 MFS transporter [Candidatus Cloacimonadota bacterium]MCK9178760.1 MFS transporter [Candidatus Cloacimonadota bacterium]MCK9242473.1 MFS transporter [Candidatus Cloacimonadota bacterium]
MSKNKRGSLIRRVYRSSITEGAFAQVYGNLAQIGSSFITKLMVLMGAGPLQYSLLSAIGQLSAIWQPLGVAFSHHISQRKWPCIWITLIGRFLTLFLGLALLFPSRQDGIWFMLTLLFFSAGFQATGANIWIAWVSDLIPLRIRGRFLARRNQILLVIGLIISYVVSYHVDLFEGGSRGLSYIARLGAESFFVPQNQALFLAFIFIFASIIGIIGLSFLALQPERKRAHFPAQSLRQVFREPFQNKNFRLLLVFGSWWMLATGIGSPFWSPFMLKNLQMGLFEVQLYNTLHMGASLLSFGFWGKFIDRFGNKTAMKICVFLGGLNPLFWLFMTAQNHSILWIEGISSGFMWAGTGIITTNFVLSIAPKRREQAYSGIYAAVVGLFMMSSTLASGIFYPDSLNLGFRVLDPEQVVFGVGALARWAALIPLALVREYRSVPLREALAYTMSRIIGWRLRVGKRG